MPLPALAAAAGAAGGGFMAGLKKLGGALLGPIAGLFGARSSDRAAAKLRREEIALQREFATHGIRWRVEDAKAAGLHPLFALSGSGAQYSPVTTSSSMGPAIAEAGQNLSRAASAVITPEERMLQALTIAKLQSEIGESDARRELYLSEAARNAQMQLPPLPGPTTDEIIGHVDATRPTPEFAKTIIPNKGDAGTAAGPTPLWRMFNLTTTPAGQDIPIVLPGGMQGDAAEVLESLSESSLMMAMVIKENVRRFGPSWGRWFTEQYLPGGSSFARGPNRARKFRKVPRVKVPGSFVPYEGY